MHSSRPKNTVRSTRDFDAIVAEATHDMPRYRQLFSAFIHVRAVAWCSDLLGKTIARPNPLLFGAVASFVTTLTLYLMAKNLGYSLSGFEAVGSFVIGWIVGLGYDFLSAIFKKK